MTRQNRSNEAGSGSSVPPVAARIAEGWRRLDTDWQSVLIAFVVVALATLANVHVPW